MCDLTHRGTLARCYKERGHSGDHQGFSHWPGQLVCWDERVRRDKLGRRIGYNWWREFIWGEWRCAYDAWLQQLADACLGYDTEEREYRHNNPSPKFKDFLIEHAGRHTAHA